MEIRKWVDKQEVLDQWPEKNESKPSEKCEFSISRGKYDANYVINLCKQIIQKCENEKFRSTELRFSLQQSLKILIANIECELMTDPTKPKTFRCDDCGEIYFTLPKETKVKCPHCLNRKQIT